MCAFLILTLPLFSKAPCAGEFVVTEAGHTRGHRRNYQAQHGVLYMLTRFFERSALPWLTSTMYAWLIGSEHLSSPGSVLTGRTREPWKYRGGNTACQLVMHVDLKCSHVSSNVLSKAQAARPQIPHRGCQYARHGQKTKKQQRKLNLSPTRDGARGRNTRLGGFTRTPLLTWRR